MPPALAYFDTSVLAKRYLSEPGARRARRWLRRYRVASSAIAPVELTSALSRRRLAGHVSEGQFRALMALVRRDRDFWELVEVSAAVLGRAEDILTRAPVKTLDALHLASALLLGDLVGARLPFVTADAGQRQGAAALDLDVVWTG